MKPIQFLAATFLACAALSPAYSSDFTGVYARIDKVVLEPAAGPPERIQVWGVFALANRSNRTDYEAPVRGYLYFRLDRNPEAARREWNDLKQVAGTGEIVALGNRSQPARLRTANEKPADPDPYGVNVGVVKVGNRTDYPPVRALLDFKN